MTIQTVKGGLWIPRPVSHGATPSYSSFLLDTNVKKCAVIFEVPETGTLDKAEFRSGAVTINAASVMRASFQTVSGANGDPSGTQDQFRDITQPNFPANTWIVPGLMTSDGTDTGTKRSVTRGQVMALVVEYSTFTAADTANIVGVANAVGGADLIGRPYIDFNGTGAFVHQNAAIGVMALKYNDGTYKYTGCLPWSAINAGTNINTGTTPNEIGNSITFPSSVSVAGCWVLWNAVGAGRDFNIKFYDTDGTTTLENFTVDADVIQNNGVPRFHYFRFASSHTLTASAAYRLTVVPQTASSNQYLDFTINAAAVMDALEGGQSIFRTERTGGAWTDTTTKRVLMGLLVDGL